MHCWSTAGLILPFYGSISQFPLRFNTVTMTADRFYKIHATISNCRFISVFTFFLVIPDGTGATARHYPRHAIICPDQLEIGLILAQQTVVFFIRYAFRHFFNDPGDSRYGLQISISAAVFQLLLNDQLNQTLTQQAAQRVLTVLWRLVSLTRHTNDGSKSRDD